MTNNKKAEEMYKEYQKGFSLAEVGRMFGVTRQSVYCMFKVRKYILRKKKKLPYQYFNGIKFSLMNNGYNRKCFGDRKLMHRYVWEFCSKKKIPKGWDVHHKDRNRANNKIENIGIMTKAEHSSKYAARQNKYTKNKLQ